MNWSLTRSNNNRSLDPWRAFQSNILDVFDDFTRDFSPKIEVKDNGTSYHVSAEIPGMDEKDINLTFKDNTLVIEGEKRSEVKDEDKKKGTYHSEFSYGKFYRSIPLSAEVNQESISASYKNGVLQIDLEKSQTEARGAKKIAIGGTKKEKH